MKLSKYGGFVYAHILNNVFPRMKDDFVSDESIATLLRENPKSVMTIV